MRAFPSVFVVMVPVTDTPPTMLNQIGFSAADASVGSTMRLD